MDPDPPEARDSLMGNAKAVVVARGRKDSRKKVCGEA
jgi:hypothetical protein